jgi:hypothetical protein
MIPFENIKYVQSYHAPAGLPGHTIKAASISDQVGCPVMKLPRTDFSVACCMARLCCEVLHEVACAWWHPAHVSLPANPVFATALDAPAPKKWKATLPRRTSNATPATASQTPDPDKSGVSQSAQRHPYCPDGAGCSLVSCVPIKDSEATPAGCLVPAGSTCLSDERRTYCLAGPTSRVILLMVPVNRVSAPMPMPSATGVWLSMPTSAVSSAEKMFGCVFSTRPSPTAFPFT